MSNVQFFISEQQEDAINKILQSSKHKNLTSFVLYKINQAIPGECQQHIPFVKRKSLGLPKETLQKVKCQAATLGITIPDYIRFVILGEYIVNKREDSPASE